LYRYVIEVLNFENEYCWEICIVIVYICSTGMRFGQLQVKLALTIILRQFTVTLSPEMKLPLELTPNVFLTMARTEILLNFSKRFK